MKSATEDKLIQLVKGGNGDAWKKLYRLYFGRVRRVVAWDKWKFRRAEVDEIVQEVFIELLKALPNFRREASLATFLTRLAKNKCISVLRRKGAQKRVKEQYGYVFDEKRTDSEDKWITVEAEIGDPLEEILFGEESSNLIKAMKELTPECQDIIKLRFFNQLAYKEICEVQDLPLGTVCSRLKRCLGKLRKIYEKNVKKT